MYATNLKMDPTLRDFFNCFATLVFPHHFFHLYTENHTYCNIKKKTQILYELL